MLATSGCSPPGSLWGENGGGGAYSVLGFRVFKGLGKLLSTSNPMDLKTPLPKPQDLLISGAGGAFLSLDSLKLCSEGFAPRVRNRAT